MAWLICGTFPDNAFDMSQEIWDLDGDADRIRGRSTGRTLPVQRGTPALLAAALWTCRALDTEPPLALLAGDQGDGAGSAALYRRLASELGSGEGLFQGITFHYLFPDLDGHSRVLAALEGCSPRPLLAADAGFMYVAKMSGYASSYDLFTPDVGELAFLADEKAPHPLYTRGFLLGSDKGVQELAELAWRHGDAARTLLVKGEMDTVLRQGELLGTVSEPLVPALEAIGGTGDVVAGIVTALLAKGLPMERACLAACRAGRRAGELTDPTPATQVAAILPQLARAVPEALAAQERDH